SDFAIASFRTPTGKEGDGVRWWWSALCRRGQPKWSCETPHKERRLDVKVNMANRHIRLEVTLPEQFSAIRAREIVTATAKLSSSPQMPLPECGTAQENASGWKAVVP